MNFVILTGPFIENYNDQREVLDMGKIEVNGKKIKLPNTVTMPVAYAGLMAMWGTFIGIAVGLATDGCYIVKKVFDKVKK